ncbi:MAG: iron-containing alcohol dehydrogenase, partial [Thermoplasmata archaeon]
LLLVAPSVSGLDGVRRIEEFVRHLEIEATTRVLAHGPSTLERAEQIVSELGTSFDTIVVVGGGQAIDLAKATRARLARPDLPLKDWTPLTDLPATGVPRLVALPSTGGSGSEMTGSAHLYDAEGGTVELSHRALAPDWALLDPAIASAVPAPLVVPIGFEVIAHAVEALASEWANPFTDALARDALASGLASLPKLARQPRDADARTSLYYAAGRAGLASANASLGLAHALARALAPEVPTLGYARLLAMALPPTIDYNFPSARDRYKEIDEQFPGGDDPTFASLSDRVRSFVRGVGLATDLAGGGIDAAPLPARRAIITERVRRSTAIVGNPRVPSPGEIGRLLDLVLWGPRGAAP